MFVPITFYLGGNELNFNVFNFIVCVYIGKLVMNHHDVAFLPSRACVSSIFFNSCGRGDSLFLCQSNFMKVMRLLAMMRQNLATLSLGDITGFIIVVSFCLYMYIYIYNAR